MFRIKELTPGTHLVMFNHHTLGVVFPYTDQFTGDDLYLLVIGNSYFPICTSCKEDRTVADEAVRILKGFFRDHFFTPFEKNEPPCRFDIVGHDVTFRFWGFINTGTCKEDADGHIEIIFHDGFMEGQKFAVHTGAVDGGMKGYNIKLKNLIYDWLKGLVDEE